jgi:hypothetical protein
VLVKTTQRQRSEPEPDLCRQGFFDVDQAEGFASELTKALDSRSVEASWCRSNSILGVSTAGNCAHVARPWRSGLRGSRPHYFPFC